MPRKPCICGHAKSFHQEVTVKVSPKPCAACGCGHYRRATKKAILNAQRELPLRPA